jgi:hypothetical protein
MNKFDYMQVMGKFVFELKKKKHACHHQVIQTVDNVIKLEVSKIVTSIHLWNGHWQCHFNCKK